MVTTFFRDSSKFKIHEKSENGRRLSPAVARGIAEQGASGQREHDGLPLRLRGPSRAEPPADRAGAYIPAYMCSLHAGRARRAEHRVFGDPVEAPRAEMRACNPVQNVIHSFISASDCNLTEL